MLAVTEDPKAATEAWLAAFEQALAKPEDRAFAALFQSDSHWRDILAFRWDYHTLSGRDSIRDALKTYAPQTGAARFSIPASRAAPRIVTRAGTRTIEAIFQFQTTIGRGSGVVRLTPDPQDHNTLMAWTLLTTLDELKGFEEKLGSARPAGQSYSRDFRGPNWLDLRRTAAAYDDRDPAVLVVGGGQSGLAIAARLKQLNVDTLIVDRERRIGDMWRNRYHALTLHNQVHVNHLPYMLFPPNWPRYVPKDKLAGWFEAYVESMELNYWTATEFEGGRYDEHERRWVVTLRRADGTRRTMRPRHVVMATGVSGIPSLPDIPSLKTFTGTTLHSSQYTDGEDWKDKRAIVIGTGNSGHDIAQDLHSSGARVTLVQRSPTLVINIEPSAQLVYTLYDEGPSLEDCDLIATGTPLQVGRKSHAHMTDHARQLDQALLDGLTAKGFKLDYGDNNTGWQFKYLTRGGGYYFNVGCSDLIVEGKIDLAQFADIETFTAGGAILKDGKAIDADLIVLATGYKGQEHLVRKLFGDGVAARIGPIWGFGEKQELRNMYTRTAQPGLWFIAGGLAQCRINSKYLALQIKACEEGML
ncbi:monooxygenase [Afipia sp. P52-10]|uniref:flavin-containing monooxygenase n=1 Tax=Afipia sp. P52-10 TaxID=1429916 RepID=UPI0003DEF932|nr:NAD(P)/FAD-dependent oxidoreductase [Afipia sp. P52-10]ETR78093.1 monooxygenase [Afipia sp. P52-10]